MPALTHAYRRRTLVIYLTIGLMTLVSTGYAIDQVWQDFAAEMLINMRYDVSHISQQVDATVTDATKVLDTAKFSIEAELQRGPVDQRHAHDILRHSTDRTSMQGSVVSQGLLFLVDQSGTLYARNSTYPVPPLEVADRLYFRSLQSDPQQRFSIGELTIGRSDQRTVFHVAEPLIDRESKFAGVVLQQIPCQELQLSLEASTKRPTGLVLVLISPSAAAFVYPLPTSPDTVDHDLVRNLFAAVLHDGKSNDLTQVTGNSWTGNDHLAYASSSNTGLITVELLTHRELLQSFLATHKNFFGVIGLVTTLVVLLLTLHYRQTIKLLNARNAALQDKLTQIPNRRALDDHFPRLWREALRQQTHISALFIDIDHFKNFNDKHGHVCADRALKLVAQTIQDCLRRPFDFACRWGGEEFVVLLPQTEAEGAMRVAETLLLQVRQITVELDDGTQVQGCISVSIGVASLLITPKHFENDLISLADKAMLQAKQKGRDQIHMA